MNKREFIYASVLLIFFFLLWFVPRQPAVMENLLLFDDYYIAYDDPRASVQASRDIYLYSYRPLLFVVHSLWELVYPGFFTTAAPNIFAGVCLSLACLGLVRLMRDLGIGWLPGILSQLVLISHPIVNELTLWNTQQGMFLVVFLMVSGYLLIGRAGAWTRLAAIGLCVAGSLGYQFYMVLLPLFWFFEAITGYLRDSRWPTHLNRKALLVIVALVLSIGILHLMRMVYPGDPRGLAWAGFTETIFTEKFHGVANITVNLFMPVLAFHFSPEFAMKHWECLIAALGFGAFAVIALDRGSFHLGLMAGLGTIAMILLPTLSILVINQSPESWRISIPSLIGFTFGYAILLQGMQDLIKNPIPGGVLSAVLVAVIMPAMIFDSTLRVESHKADKAILLRSVDFWKDQNIDIADVRFGATPDFVNTTPVDTQRPGQLMVSYRIIEPQDYSAFMNLWSWDALVLSRGFGVLQHSQEAYAQLYSKCEKERAAATQLQGWVVVHSLLYRSTLVC